MPLVRAQVRNEYGLGQPELYKEVNREDPKAVLDSIAVAGLVGILRQLGDLAEFAAEVFHGLQEQVMSTASRSHKLTIRVQRIEAALPPLEKAVLAQTSHIHFAYTAGYCILIHLFDAGGPGSCLQRYSDPTFFKRASGSSIEEDIEKVPTDKRTRKSKVLFTLSAIQAENLDSFESISATKRRSSHRNGKLSRGASLSSCSGRMQFTSVLANGRASSQNASTVDMALKSDIGEHSSSFDSRTGSGYIECAFNLGSSMLEELEPKEFSSKLMQETNTLGSNFPVDQTRVLDDNFSHSSSQEQIVPSSSCVTWDEKAEIVESKAGNRDIYEVPEMNFDVDVQEIGIANARNGDQVHIPFNDVDAPQASIIENQNDEIESEPDNYMDALNTIESESENDIECHRKQEVEQCSENDIECQRELGLERSEDANNVSNENREDEEVVMDDNVDSNSSIIEPSASSNIISSNGMSGSSSDPVASENIPCEQVPQISGKSSDPDRTSNTGLCISEEICNGSQAEFIISDPSPSSGSTVSDMHDPASDRIMNSVNDSQNSQTESSSVHSVGFWTNGGLLGLQPSKPPDFAVSTVGQGSAATTSEVFGPPNQILMSLQDGLKGNAGTVVENANLDANLGRPVNSHFNDNLDNLNGVGSSLNTSVTWDEKAEIVESKAGNRDIYEVPEMNFDVDVQEIGIANARNGDQVHIPFNDVDAPQASIIENQNDEIESEPDNYMDALNTIESESENDIECHRKQEVEQCSENDIECQRELGLERSEDANNVSNENREDEEVVMDDNVDSNSSIIEPSASSNIISSNGMSGSSSDPVASENIPCEQVPQISGKSSDPDRTSNTGLCISEEICNGSQAEFIISDPSPSSGSTVSDMHDPASDRIMNSVNDSQNSQTESSSVHSVGFWTNGGLLGLQPSKPPDFAVSTVGQGSAATTSEVFGPPNQILMSLQDGLKGNAGTVVENANLDANLGRPVNSHFNDNLDNLNGVGSILNTSLPHGNKNPVNPNIKATSIDSDEEDDDKSSRMFGLGHKLLVNGFRRKVSIGNDDDSEPATSTKTGVLEPRNEQQCISYQKIPQTTVNEQIGNGSPINSLTSSPPLEHMKISFNPLDGFGTSKLKLQFPDGNHYHENIRDMFPSFQLVPVPAISAHGVASDSDDDTFCRSSPYMSDYCLSHCSESNSEQWESGEAPESNDPALYDALSRLSSMESVSSCLQVGGAANNGICVNGGNKKHIAPGSSAAEPSLSMPLDLPGFDVINPVLHDETKSNSDQKNQKPEPPLVNQQEINDKANALKPEKKVDEEKNNGQEGVSLLSGGGGMDEKEDFLHQIRTKSFNLRPTATARPTVISGPTANVQVTAILQKANAIRQAVGSDDDDNWSDN
ncbi:hypothetical protein GOBAR_AA21624 [Gossypium barbadense]|uniref:Protein SCAR n=1 Tax=Gossypium barbadense TaxID=3634 RepID=A0A2P5X6R4_GOSBA|nr:hypothetical protein GOBAR_AA21624 [Gossypium barbadense]